MNKQTRTHHPLTKTPQKLKELREAGLCADCEINPRGNKSYCTACHKRRYDNWKFGEGRERWRLNQKVGNINTSAATRYGTSDKVSLERVEHLLRTTPNCPYCGIELKTENIQYDHIHPMSKGGRNTDDNIQITCSVCNYAKGQMTEAEFLEWVNRVHTNRSNT